MKPMTVLLGAAMLLSLSPWVLASEKTTASLPPADVKAAATRPADATASDSKPAGTTQAEAQPESKDAATLSGKIVETMDGGGYTYFLIEKDGKKTWVATPPTAAKVGDEITLQPGIEMANFKSRAIGRTFERIIFSGGLVQPEGSTANEDFLRMKAHESVKQQAAQPVAEEKVPNVKVEKASAPNGYTIAELFEKSAELNGKQVVVQARVIKISRGIMGKNWVHLQDGSGDAAKGPLTLVVTTQNVVAKGDTVTAQGTLAKDKDFGGGYQYSVIVEETAVTKK